MPYIKNKLSQNNLEGEKEKQPLGPKKEFDWPNKLVNSFNVFKRSDLFEIYKDVERQFPTFEHFSIEVISTEALQPNASFDLKRSRNFTREPNPGHHDHKRPPLKTNYHSEWFLKAADGSVQGPISRAETLELFKKTEIGSNTLLGRDKNHFETLESLVKNRRLLFEPPGNLLVLAMSIIEELKTKLAINNKKTELLSSFDDKEEKDSEDALNDLELEEQQLREKLTKLPILREYYRSEGKTIGIERNKTLFKELVHLNNEREMKVRITEFLLEEEKEISGKKIAEFVTNFNEALKFELEAEQTKKKLHK